MAVQTVKLQYLSVNGSPIHATWALKNMRLRADIQFDDAANAGVGAVALPIQGMEAYFIEADCEDLDTMADDLWAIKGTNVAFEARRDQAAVSATNPKYTGTLVARLPEQVINAELGRVHRGRVTFPVYGFVTRAEA